MNRGRSIERRGAPWRRAGVAALLLAWVPCARPAELAVFLRLEHDSVLQFEPLRAFVTIRNDSVRPFVLDEGGAELEFRIRKQNRREVAPRKDRPALARVRVAPGRQEELMIDLSPRYEVTAMGNYTVGAVVRWDGRAYRSADVLFDVVRGIEIAKAERTVFGYGDLVREYSLRYWPRDGREEIFLSVDEKPTGRNYGVFPLGRLIRIHEPAIKVDVEGNVVVVHQSAADRFTRTVLKSARHRVYFVDQTYHTRAPEEGSAGPSTGLD